MQERRSEPRAPRLVTIGGPRDESPFEEEGCGRRAATCPKEEGRSPAAACRRSR